MFNMLGKFSQRLSLLSGSSVWFRDMNHLPMHQAFNRLERPNEQFSPNQHVLHEEHEGKTDEDEGQGHDR